MNLTRRYSVLSHSVGAAPSTVEGTVHDVCLQLAGFHLLKRLLVTSSNI